MNTRRTGPANGTMARLRTILTTAARAILWGLLGAGIVHAQPVRPVPQAGGENDPSAVVTREQALDLREADAFIQQVFATGDVNRYDAAAQTYLSLLAHLDGAHPPEEQALLLRHLTSTAFLLPGSTRIDLGLDEALTRGNLAALPGGLGARLVQWWRRQDTFPATEHNERLQEHLARVAFARAAYGSRDDARGFDDRGEIYVRLGAPSGKTTIRLNPAIAAFDFRNALSVPDVPENEFWVYNHLGDAAHYLFIREGKHSGYRLGYASDLIPPRLRSGRRNTQMLLHVMEEVYAQLALEHPSYGTLHDAVATYRGLPYPSADQPDRFATSLLARAQAEDMQAEDRREEAVPAAYSGAFGHAETLAVPVRWARFLDDDGTTRTEIYWSPDVSAMRPSRRLVRQLERQGHQPSEQYLLSVSVAHRLADQRTRQINRKHYLVAANTEQTLPVQSFVVRGDTETYHLALQWDESWVRTSEGRTEPGARLKTGTCYLDTLRALDGQGYRLEMSDLKPLLRARTDKPEADTPYPYAALTPGTSLALYLELYHLTFGPADQTHYTIEYEIARRRKQGGILRFPGRGTAERTAVRTRYTGSTRTARERVALDLKAWQGEGEIVITIRATDDTTGAQVARSITFALEQ